MENNLFEELQQKKQRLIGMAEKAAEYGWIDSARKEEIINKINNDVLTIGVIGQMKCGKSTFLNAFVFEDDVLPSATTPMTAALSVITYGEQKRIVAEFYTQDEWEEQKMQASRSLDDVKGNSLEESKVKAAKELVEKAGKLGGNIDSYLGKTQEDSFENLIEYVGADGKYVSITKSVKIYYPKDYLKGVEVVDTPGFNDPIVSREERTKDFLRKADVVVLMLYANRAFDATDRDILFKNVRNCGVGKVIIGVNKYDIPCAKGQYESEITDYVKEEITKACQECKDDIFIQILKQSDPILLSAEMALLSELSMEKIKSKEEYLFAWNRHCNDFGISTRKEMFEISHLDNLTNAVREIIAKEKDEILLAKPMNAIMAAGNKKKSDIETELGQLQMLMADLEKPDDELDERLELLAKANRRLNKKIDGLGDDLDIAFKELVRKGGNEMEDMVDKTCREMDSEIDGLGLFQSYERIIPSLEGKLQTLVTRTLKRHVEDLGQQAKSKIHRTVGEFLNDAEEVLMKYVPDFDTQDFIKKLEREIDVDTNDKDVFTYDATPSESEGKPGYADYIFAFLNGASYGSLQALSNAFEHSTAVNKMHEIVNSIKANFDPEPYLNSIFGQKDAIINKVKESFITNLIEPLLTQVEEIKANKGDKEKTLKNTKSQIESLVKAKQIVEEQLAIIN